MALPGFPKTPFDREFDRDFNAAKRGFALAGTGVGCGIIVSWLIGIAMTVACIAVAWHFIAKFW